MNDDYLDKIGQFDGETIAQLEQDRRLQIIKAVANQPFDYGLWQERSAETLVKYDVFAQWCFTFQKDGPHGLTPTLEPIRDKEKERVLRYLKKLSPVLGKDVITDDDIHYRTYLRKD